MAPGSAVLAWMAIFAALSLILAGAGIYGVVAASAARRAKEFGIRRTLGADTSELLGMAVCQGMSRWLGVALFLAGGE